MVGFSIFGITSGFDISRHPPPQFSPSWFSSTSSSCSGTTPSPKTKENKNIEDNQKNNGS
jgi:hypothetical protein